ncbi:MAG: hypothetical protein ACLSAP_02065 [Oscillospiraceae bacterium]
MRAFEKPVGFAFAGMFGTARRTSFSRDTKTIGIFGFPSSGFADCERASEQAPGKKRQRGKLQRPKARNPCHQDQNHIEQQQRKGKLVEAIAPAINRRNQLSIIE